MAPTRRAASPAAESARPRRRPSPARGPPVPRAYLIGRVATTTPSRSSKVKPSASSSSRMRALRGLSSETRFATPSPFATAMAARTRHAPTPRRCQASATVMVRCRSSDAWTRETRAMAANSGAAASSFRTSATIANWRS